MSRQVLSAFTVTNTSNSETGTLRQAIINSNAVNGPNTISLDIPGGGFQTINLLSALPMITQPVTIDGTTEPNSGGQPVIQIDETNAGSIAYRLHLIPTASGSTIKDLAVTDFANGGVLLNGASNVTLANDDIGLVNRSTGAAELEPNRAHVDCRRAAWMSGRNTWKNGGLRFADRSNH